MNKTNSPSAAFIREREGESQTPESHRRCSPEIVIIAPQRGLSVVVQAFNRTDTCEVGTGMYKGCPL